MLRVFEAFSGYGSQSMALKNLGVNYHSVGISEIDENAILSYASIHTEFLEIKDEIEYPTEGNMKEYLRSINAPLDYKTFKFKADKFKGDRLKNIWLACILTKNKGDVSRVDVGSLRPIDLFTYSFPCQDVSIAGDQKGVVEGTRSGLLWECCKIIEAKKPKFLLMENVKNLVAKKHKGAFDSFLEYLEGQGYTNHWKVLNAKDYGVPQNRERVFVVSVLDGEDYEFPMKQELDVRLRDVLEPVVDEKFFIDKPFTLVSKPNSNVVAECHLENFDQNKRVYGIDGTFQCLGARERGTNKILVEDDTRIRKLTPLECFRLMGCSDKDFYKAQQVSSDSQLYKQAGNSIVVPVLERIFNNLLTTV